MMADVFITGGGFPGNITSFIQSPIVPTAVDPNAVAMAVNYYNNAPDDVTRSLYLASLKNNPNLYNAVLQSINTPQAPNTTTALGQDSFPQPPNNSNLNPSTTNSVPPLSNQLANNLLGSGTATDTRIRLKAQLGQEAQVYGPQGTSGLTQFSASTSGNGSTPNAVPSDGVNIMSILYETNGLLFPYTPAITVEQSVKYNEVDLVHTNNGILAYIGTPSVNLSVNAKFTVQNQREGQYALAVLHFLRTISKMYFGETDKQAGKAGLPPPILIFDGYGNYMFNKLPVVLKSHTYSFDDSMNMVTIQGFAGTSTTLPALFQVSMTLEVQQTPMNMRKAFSLDKFRTGELLRAGSGGWI